MKTLRKQAAILIIAVCSAAPVFAFKNVSPNYVKARDVKAKTFKRASVRDLKFRNIEFDLNRASIRKSSYGELDRVVNALQDNKASINVAGHADSRGTYVYNWNLSKARAESVKKYIVDKGYDESKIAATEFGDTKPIASNKTPNGRQKNRRVELALY